MNDQLRADVWEAMVDSDRLERYYGRRAAKLARWEAVLRGATCTLAVVSAILLSVGSTHWAGATIAATALVSIGPLLSRLGDRVLSAAYCQKRLGDLSIEWRALWQDVDQLPAEEVRSRWKSLAQRLNFLEI